MIKSVIATSVVITLFACQGNYNNVQQLSLKDNEPIAVGTNINLKYVDSGRVVTNLISPRTLDYSTLEYPYREFPKGLEVRFWDDKGKQSVITSDYAIEFADSKLVDLRKNVKIVTSDTTTLYAEQLYWDQKNKWVFTDLPYKIQFKDGSFNDGARLDGSEDFKTFMSRGNQSVQLVDKADLEKDDN